MLDGLDGPGAGECRWASSWRLLRLSLSLIGFHPFPMMFTPYLTSLLSLVLKLPFATIQLSFETLLDRRGEITLSDVSKRRTLYVSLMTLSVWSMTHSPSQQYKPPLPLSSMYLSCSFIDTSTTLNQSGAIAGSTGNWSP